MLARMAFVFFVTVIWSILFFVHSIVYIPVARVFDISFPQWYLVIGILSGTYFLASVAVRKFTSVIADWFYFVSASWLGVIFLMFSVMLVYEIVHVFTGYDSRLVLGSLLSLACIASIYALIQGRNLTTHEHVVPIRNLMKPMRVVHLSDIHVDTVHQIRFLERVVAETNALRPDMVLITGDLFDGSAPIEEHMLTPLNTFCAPCFFSNGNHEEYEGLERVRATLKNINLELLDNKMVLHEGIQIVGVNDRQSLPKGVKLGSVLKTMELEEDVPTLLMYHSPVQWHDARAGGVDLMLSGHTHNGQLYPFTLLVRLFFKYINGLYEEDGRHLHVSPGTGTWGPPMRLGSKNQITLLNLIPSSMP